MRISTRVFAPALLIGIVILLSPLFVRAAGMDSDVICKTVCPKYLAMNPPQPQLCLATACTDTTNGVTAGHCTLAFVCKGQTANGTGLDSSTLSQLGQMLGQLMGKLMQGGQQQSSPSSGAPPHTSPTGTTGCQGAYFQTSNVSDLTNPCAQYVAPPVTTPTGTSTCDALSQQLGICGTQTICPKIMVDCAIGYVAVQQSGTDANGCPLRPQCVAATSAQSSGTTPSAPTTILNLSGLGTSSVNLSGLGSPASPSPLTSGDILLGQNGATIFGNSLNVGGNTIVAGFYGGNTIGGAQPQGLAAQLCQSRPWANAFISAIIPVNFFDGLCSWRGYQVGSPPPQQQTAAQPQVQLQQSAPVPKKTATTTAATSTAPLVPASVKVWAVPASVPLDTRTSIFWTTSGVTDCTVSSPDGQFNQTTLSGGAATVPLVTATTFTISCLDSQGNPVTDYTTVTIAL